MVPDADCGTAIVVGAGAHDVMSLFCMTVVDESSALSPSRRNVTMGDSQTLATTAVLHPLGLQNWLPMQGMSHALQCRMSRFKSAQ
jgi:hypothetical protein